MKQGLKQLVASDDSLSGYTIDAEGWKRIEITHSFLEVTFIINL
jgi:hypothetical protein